MAMDIEQAREMSLFTQTDKQGDKQIDLLKKKIVTNK